MTLVNEQKNTGAVDTQFAAAQSLSGLIIAPYTADNMKQCTSTAYTESIEFSNSLIVVYIAMLCMQVASVYGTSLSDLVAGGYSLIEANSMLVITIMFSPSLTYSKI